MRRDDKRLRNVGRPGIGIKIVKSTRGQRRRDGIQVKVLARRSSPGRRIRDGIEGGSIATALLIARGGKIHDFFARQHRARGHVINRLRDDSIGEHRLLRVKDVVHDDVAVRTRIRPQFSNIGSEIDVAHKGRRKSEFRRRRDIVDDLQHGAAFIEDRRMAGRFVGRIFDHVDPGRGQIVRGNIVGRMVSQGIAIQIGQRFIVAVGQNTHGNPGAPKSLRIHRGSAQLQGPSGNGQARVPNGVPPQGDGKHAGRARDLRDFVHGHKRGDRPMAIKTVFGCDLRARCDEQSAHFRNRHLSIQMNAQHDATCLIPHGFARDSVRRVRRLGRGMTG